MRRSGHGTHGLGNRYDPEARERPRTLRRAADLRKRIAVVRVGSRRFRAISRTNRGLEPRRQRRPQQASITTAPASVGASSCVGEKPGVRPAPVSRASCDRLRLSADPRAKPGAGAPPPGLRSRRRSWMALGTRPFESGCVVPGWTSSGVLWGRGLRAAVAEPPPVEPCPEVATASARGLVAFRTRCCRRLCALEARASP